MILDIRGTHGSGKSTVARRFIETYENKCLLGPAYEPWEDAYKDGKEQHLGYLIEDLDLVVLGNYSNTCGGCDGIKTADEVCRRVDLFHSEGLNVLLEGILVSHTYGRYRKLAKELGNYHFLFLDTPMEVCIERVKQRRLQAGNTKEFNPKNLVKDFKTIGTTVRQKLEADSLLTHTLDHNDPTPYIMDLLKNASN